MLAEDRTVLAALITEERQAALGTLAEGTPFVSMVLYAVDNDPVAGPSFIIHVSRLSPHTRYLEAEPRASLLIARPDAGDDETDPQALPRVTIQVVATPLAPGSEPYERAKAAYIARLPRAEYLFSFPDFTLFRLVPTEARFIGGFAKAFAFSATRLREVLE